jgi:hypothetical protein
MGWGELVAGLQEHLLEIGSTVPGDASAIKVTELLTATIEEYALSLGGSCVRELRLGVSLYIEMFEVHTRPEEQTWISACLACPTCPY